MSEFSGFVGSVSKLVIRLLSGEAPQTEEIMRRIGLGGSVLATLMLMYWVSPALAWVALAASSSLMIAKRTRQARQVAGER